MILEDWLLIDTLAAPDTWSVLAVGTSPRRWKSLARTVPARLIPIVTAAAAGAEVVEPRLPKSRQAWSGLLARAVPLSGPDDRVHAVQMWVGEGEPPPPPVVATYLLDARTRRTEIRSAGPGGTCESDRTVWVGAEVFEPVERFDEALDLAALVARATPETRWCGDMCVRTPEGLRTLMLATRNSEADPQVWRGVLADITDSVAPRPKSFEALTVDTLMNRDPGLHLAVLDTERLHVIRWISRPLPRLASTGGADERSLPHPDDRDRVVEARRAIRSGVQFVTLSNVRLVATDGGWLTVDVEVSPLPYRPGGTGTPHFALARIDLRARESPGT